MEVNLKWKIPGLLQPTTRSLCANTWAQFCTPKHWSGFHDRELYNQHKKKSHRTMLLVMQCVFLK